MRTQNINRNRRRNYAPGERNRNYGTPERIGGSYSYGNYDTELSDDDEYSLYRRGSSEYSSPQYNRYIDRPYREYRGSRNVFGRQEDRIRDTWDDRRYRDDDREVRNRDFYRDYGNRARGRGRRNFFGRLGEGIREAWHDITHDDRENQSDYEYYQDYLRDEPSRYERVYSTRNENDLRYYPSASSRRRKWRDYDEY